MELDILRSAAQLEPLRAEWIELHDRAPAATAFQRPEWLLPWLDAFGAVVRAIAVRQSGMLMALALFTMHEAGAELKLAGAGNSDYLDIVVDAEAGGDVLTSVGDASREISGWSTATFEHLRAEAACRQLPSPAGYDDATSPQERCPAVALEADAGAYYARLAPGFIERLHYARRRAARASMRLVDGAGEDPGQAFDTLVALHARRWSARGAPGVLADPVTFRFLRQVAGELAASGRLLLPVLYIDGRPAAALMGLRDRHAIRYYIGGFDPGLAHFSPGTVLLSLVIEEAIADGVPEFDFLRGSERYKYDWGAVDRLTVQRTLRRAAGRAA